MRLFVFTCGSVTAPFRGAENGEITVPVPCYLIEHEQGRVLVDTGMHPGMREDPHVRIGWLADLMRVGLPEGEDAGSRLRAIGVEPGSLRYLVNTHLHFDHAGGTS
jgi:N-acyl homoserine lactone hydrolase